jgi:hypothetical protein
VSPTTVDRTNWAELARAFSSFFTGAGTVVVDDEVVRFDGAPVIETGLELRADGTSRSFMPLHGLDARWERVTFDRETDTVTLAAGDLTYTFRVPPGLRRS